MKLKYKEYDEIMTENDKKDIMKAIIISGVLSNPERGKDRGIYAMMSNIKEAENYVNLITERSNDSNKNED